MHVLRGSTYLSKSDIGRLNYLFFLSKKTDAPTEAKATAITVA